MTEQFKVAHHTHTTNSDGDHSLASVLEEHYRKGFDIVAITDHDYTTRSWVRAGRGLTQERRDEMGAGVGRGGRFMLQIPDTTEMSNNDTHHHLGTYIVETGLSLHYVRSHDPFSAENYPRTTPEQRSTGFENMKATAQLVEDQGGFSHVNHPGRYTGGQNAPGPSNDSVYIDRYAALFMDFETCVGMEIINKKDGESHNDRILWDNINTVTIPQNRYVWGFSNDDSHNNRDVGFSFNMFRMDANTVDEYRRVMEEGDFYAVARIAHNEGVNSGTLSDEELRRLLAEPTPAIKSIERTATTITIVAEHYDHIEWVTRLPSDATDEVITNVVGQGETLNLATAALGPFVRANVIGEGGVAFTQPLPVS